MLAALKKELRKNKDLKTAKLLQGYFKTGKGQYGSGDIFLGIKVPVLRGLAKKYRQLGFADTLKLLKSPWHEARMLALFILIGQYRSAEPAGKEKIYRAYLRHFRYINNWDLVDLSAKYIVGDFLLRRNRSVVYRLAASSLVWERRIAVLSTFQFVSRNDFKDSLKLAKLLLTDKHDLIHKASGWMLREIAKKDKASVEDFLRRNCRQMPRTMLRYAIERFPQEERMVYLKLGKSINSDYSDF